MPSSTQVFILYSTSNCKLCTEAVQMLNSLQRSHGFLLIETKLKSGDPLYTEFKTQFPVLQHNGKTVAWGRMDEMAILTILRNHGS
ncbi:MAG: glutaredoxin family protein [Bacteroidetes bacterium]|nr:glutaredoxin family protein [Bacteroidota bacterium]